MAQAEYTIVSDFRVNGYPVETTVYYIYCDKCGSFRIRNHIKVFHWLCLILFIIITSILYNQYILTKYGFQNLAVWGLYAVAILIGVVILKKYLPHKCLKCGNTNISYRDIRGYSGREDLYLVADVPKSGLHQHEEGDISFFKDLKMFIIGILGMFLIPVMMLIAIIYQIVKEVIFDRDK